jgi:hypothetical protein
MNLTGHDTTSTDPLNCEDFKKVLLARLGTQFLSILVPVCVYELGHRLGRADIQYLGVIFFGLPVLTGLKMMKEAQRRLQDIYPGLDQSSRKYVLFYWICPLVFLGFMLFLALKKTSNSSAPPILFRKPKLLVFLFLPTYIFLDSIISGSIPQARVSGMNQASYWLSTPTIYHIVTIADEVRFLLEKYKVSKISPEKADPVPFFKNFADTGAITSTDVISMLSSTVQVHSGQSP